MSDRSPRARLARWIAWTGLSEREIARRLDCHQSYPGKLLSDPKRLPGLKVAYAIERASAEPRDDGKRWTERPIRAAEWLEQPAPTRRRAGNAEKAA